jgi:hypothetical protein
MALVIRLDRCLFVLWESKRMCQPNRRSLWIHLAAFAIVLAGVGCSSGPNLGDPVKVSGKITRKGKPMANVTVGFITTSEGVPGPYRYAASKTDADGAYLIEKVYPGEYLVSVVPEAPAPDPSGMVQATPGDPALAKYGTDSPLKADVVSGEQEFSFDIPE